MSMSSHQHLCPSSVLFLLCLCLKPCPYFYTYVLVLLILPLLVGVPEGEGDRVDVVGLLLVHGPGLDCLHTQKLKLKVALNLAKSI